VLDEAEKIDTSSEMIDRQLAWTSQRARTIYNDDIKKVMREEIKTRRQQMLYDNILDFRKLLLVFRLLH
jgi:hypothetical protein